MGMNLKDDEAHRLAGELSRLTGQSLTDAVKPALSQELKRARQTGRAGATARGASRRDRPTLRRAAGSR